MTILGIENNKPYKLNLKNLNRHGLITGATGTGKTTTVKKIIELLQENNISTLAIDIKGDLSSLAEANALASGAYYPIELLDFYGLNGKKLNISIEDLGIYALANLLNLTNVQTGVLATAFLYSKNNSYELNSIDDLYYTLNSLSYYRLELAEEYGHLSNASIATIIRKMNILKIEGNDLILNKTNIIPSEIATSKKINIIDGSKLSNYTHTYSSVINYILKSFNQDMDEVGDLDKPKAVILVDESHLLFKNVSKEVLNDNIKTIKLIRSKGIGVIFISQLPSDIPDEILSQLGMKIQHGLRLFTAKDYTVGRNIARTFSSMEKVNDTIEVINKLAIGETLIQQINDKGIPTTSGKVKIKLPNSKDGTLSDNIKENILLRYKPFNDYKTKKVDHIEKSYKVRKRPKDLKDYQKALIVIIVVYVLFLFLKVIS